MRTLVNLFCLVLTFCISRPAFAGNEVRPLATFSIPMDHESIPWLNVYTRILVKNIAYEKKVAVVYHQADGDSTVAARYVGPAQDGYEVWEAYSNLAQGDASFYLEYEAAGRAFKDDNQGAGYALPVGAQFYQKQNIQQLLSEEFSSHTAGFVAAVRSDLAYEKHVQVHYSYEHFAHTQDLDLRYQSYFPYGYGILYGVSPQQTELWAGQINDVPSAVSVIEYYLSYEANGITYYDSNFGQNYRLVRAD